MRQFIICITLLLGLASGMQAQNKIDKMVERLSITGNCKLTSAVLRNPDTREIQKTVKVLEVTSLNADDFIDAFRKEAKKNNSHQERKGSELIITLDTHTPTANRIYMLEAHMNGPKSSLCNWAKITIIVKRRKN